MEKKILKPHNGKKQNYALKAFLWGAAVIALFIVPSMIMDKGIYMYFGDYNQEVIPFYQLMSESIRTGDTGWSWYTDLGSNFVGAYSVVNLGSPFFLFMVLFPSSWIPYLLGPLTILEFGISSLGAYIYLKRYVKDKNNAVTGAVLYAFSGFAIYNMVFQFGDSIALFPFLIAALDAFIYDKKRGYFAFMVALSSLVNYYIFIAEAIFLVLYWAVRLASKSFKYESFKETAFLVFEAVLGVGMSLFLFLPSIYHIVGNARVNSSNWVGWNFWVYSDVLTYVQFIASMFAPPEIANANVYTSSFNTTWCSITAFLPLFSMAGVFAVTLNKRRNKWFRVFYTVCLIIMFIPILNSAFQMFTEAKYIRWVFMAQLIMSLGSVMALEDNATKWKKSVILNFIGVIIIALVLGVTPTITVSDENLVKVIGISGASDMFWVAMSVAFFNVALLVLFISIYKNNKNSYRRACSVIAALAVVVTVASTFVPSKASGERDVNIVEHGMLNAGDKIEIDDIQQWRSDVLSYYNYGEYKYDDDQIESYDLPDISTAISSRLEELYSEEDANVYMDLDNLTIFWHIPGIECFHSAVNGSIMTLFNGFDFNRTTLSSWPFGMYAIRSFLSTKYMFNHDDSTLKFEDENGDTLMPGWKYYGNMNGFDVYENEYCIPMGQTYDKFIYAEEFEKIPAQYRHLVLIDALVVHEIDDMFECASMGMGQLTAADCDFSREGYFEHCEERIASACYEFSRDNKGFDARVKTGEFDEYVLFTVPYDNGWSAQVNGEKTEIKITDYGFMSVKVPANTDSTIRFNYHTPGLVYGSFVSILCLVMLLIYLAAMKIQSSPSDAKTDGGKEVTKPTEENNSESSEESYDDITLFDIVKQTEEQNMMHVYGRVPVALESGYGSTAWDIDGKKYIDFTSGIGVNALGYAEAGWSDAVEAQMNKVTHMSNLYYNTTQIQLAELLCMKTGFSKVFFANSGAEANECAIKTARKYGSDTYGRGHTHIVTLENSFHGRTITTLAATGQDSFHKHFEPFTEGFDYAKANDMESVRSKVNENTCAVMIELVQGEGGVNPLDKEFVTELAQYCSENGILLIVDEIQTGMGRTGKLFCYENYGITPDIITSAKALGGGLPLSACLCGEKLADVMTIGTNGTTFGGNPIACAGAMRILEVVSEENFLEEVRRNGEYMRERISKMKGVSEVRGMGLMIGVVLEKDNAKDVMLKCAENGLLVLTAKNLIRLLPPLNIDEFDIDEGLEILEQSILDTLDGDKEE